MLMDIKSCDGSQAFCAEHVGDQLNIEYDNIVLEPACREPDFPGSSCRGSSSMDVTGSYAVQFPSGSYTVVTAGNFRGSTSFSATDPEPVLYAQESSFQRYSGDAFTFFNTPSSGEWNASNVSVPEPASAALLFFGLALGWLTPRIRGLLAG